MKQVTISCILGAILICGCAHAETNFYDQVTQTWLNGQKAEVYCIATNRLAVNSNDIAGLILKLEYELAYYDLKFTNPLQRVVDVGSDITTTNFAILFPVLRDSVDYMQDFVLNYPTNNIEQEILKASITNKPFGHRRILKATEQDGLITD
jgi:hypothetical protein